MCTSAIAYIDRSIGAVLATVGARGIDQRRCHKGRDPACMFIVYQTDTRPTYRTAYTGDQSDTRDSWKALGGQMSRSHSFRMVNRTVLRYSGKIEYKGHSLFPLGHPYGCIVAFSSG